MKAKMKKLTKYLLMAAAVLVMTTAHPITASAKTGDVRILYGEFSRICADTVGQVKAQPKEGPLFRGGTYVEAYGNIYEAQYTEDMGWDDDDAISTKHGYAREVLETNGMINKLLDEHRLVDITDSQTASLYVAKDESIILFFVKEQDNGQYAVAKVDKGIQTVSDMVKTGDGQGITIVTGKEQDATGKGYILFVSDVFPGGNKQFKLTVEDASVKKYGRELAENSVFMFDGGLCNNQYYARTSKEPQKMNINLDKGDDVIDYIGYNDVYATVRSNQPREGFLNSKAAGKLMVDAKVYTKGTQAMYGKNAEPRYVISCEVTVYNYIADSDFYFVNASGNKIQACTIDYAGDSISCDVLQQKEVSELYKGTTIKLFRRNKDLPDATVNADIIEATSSNEAVATITDKGLLEIKGGGKTTITMVSESQVAGNNLRATLDLTVEEYINKISFTDVAPTLPVGLKYDLGKIVKIESDTVTQKELKWSSSDSTVAEVNNQGVVTAKKAGYCKITAQAAKSASYKSDEMISKSIDIKVETALPNTGISFNLANKSAKTIAKDALGNYCIPINTTYILNVVPAVANTNDRFAITFATKEGVNDSDLAEVKVSADGKSCEITALSSGIITVTATSESGSKTISQPIDIYLGESLADVNVKDLVVNEGNISASLTKDGYFEYIAYDIMPVPSYVKDNGATIDLDSTNVEITYANNLKPGTATMTIKGKGNYCPELVGLASAKGQSVRFTIKPRDLTKAKIEISQTEYEYDGEEHEPDFAVTYVPQGKQDSITLIKEEDYEIAGYENNVNAGTATLKIRGIDGCSGEKTANYTIKPMNIADGKVNVEFDQDEYSYTGDKIMPEMTVTYNDMILEEGVDYTVKYDYNVDIGTAKAEITAVEGGNYTGKRTDDTFYIVKRKLEETNITVMSLDGKKKQTKFNYTAEEILPKIVVKDGSKTLKKDKDYTISYSENVNPTKKNSMAKITISAVEESFYQGNNEAEFEIVLKKGQTFKDKGNGLKLKVTKVSEKGTGTLSVVGGASKNVDSIYVPSTILIGNTTYRVTDISKNAFKGYKKLNSVRTDECKYLTSIGKDAFNGCKKLEAVEINSSAMTKIADSAFNGCTKLRTVTLATKKLTTIGKKAFYGCKMLSDVTIKSTKLTLAKTGSDAFKNTAKGITFRVPSKSVKSYKTIFKKRGAKNAVVTKY